MANQLTPEELATEFGLPRKDVIRLCVDGHVPIFRGRVDRALFAAVLAERGHRASYHVLMRERGVLTLPAEIRRRYHLDEPGAQVEIVDRGDGVLELRPKLAVPADQAWFFTREWQAGERDADADIAAGRVSTSENAADFVDELDAAERDRTAS